MKALYDVPAPAKLNLFLHVTGRRDDGYHLLQSVFVLIDWADRLSFERRTDGLLVRHDLTTALPADDLCLRAARALQTAGGSALGADISIDKQLPWGAGLGGGSSDAATTLLSLNRLWGLDLPLSQLAEIGLSLGADVPFFIGGHNAWVEGIGEKLTPIVLPAQRYAVVKPAEAIATVALFNSPLLTRDTKAATLAGLLERHGQEGFAQALTEGYGRNDLQPAAQSECDEVAQAARWLESHFGNSRMTGSGSAVFARVDKRGNDGSAGINPGTEGTLQASMPADLPPQWVGRMCRSLLQHPLVGWATN